MINITLKIKEILKRYINDNFKEYMLFLLLFAIGLFVGVMIVNNCNETQMKEICSYIEDFIGNVKNTEIIDKSELIFKSIRNNIFLVIILWIAGTAVIGLPVVIVVIFFRGLCLGYTIATITYTLGTIKGILFCLISIFFKNIFFIPAILTLGVSSIKLYRSIVKDRRRENIKLEFVRHTIVSIFMLIILIISSIIENEVSLSILQNLIKYF